MKNFLKSNSNKLKEKKTTNKKSKYAIITFRIISLLIIFLCLYRLLTWSEENRANNELMSNLRTQIDIPESIIVHLPNSYNTSSTSIKDATNSTEDINESLPLIDFSNLVNLNPDTVAWLQVNNTDIDFPVVKTTNNDYYIKHNFDKKYNSAGWIFADYRNKFDNTDKNIIIYGHNRRDGSMFSTLNNILEEKWYTNTDNYIITLYTPTKNINYQVFSIYKIKSSNFDNTTIFENDSKFQEYLDTAINHSIYDFNQSLSTSDKLLTLYTCDNNNSYRIILHAKQIN